MADASHEHRAHFSQTDLPLLACVKTDPDYYDASSLPNPNNLKIKLESSNCESDALSNRVSNGSNEKNHDEKSRKRKADPLSIKYQNYSKIKLELNEHKADELSSDDRKPIIKGHICDLISTMGAESVEPRGKKFVDIISKDVIANLVKSNLSSCEIQSVFKTSISCNVKSYDWEKLVDNEFISKIDENMKRTVESVLLLEDEYKGILNEVIEDLNDAFDNEKGKYHWHCIGSYSYGLVHGNSTIDVYCEGLPLKDVPQNLFRELSVSVSFHKRFKKTSQKFSENGITCIDIRHKNTGKLIHISFSNALEIRSSLLMKFFLSINPNLKYLIVYVEIFLKKYRVGMGWHDFSSDVVFWLVTFFLQQKKLLPAVIDVRKAANMIYYVSGWDCSLPEDYSFPTEPVSLYSLLLGFFDFYNNFDFLNYVICPHLGRVLALSDIEQLQLSADEFSVYLKQIRNPHQITFSRYFLNLQDTTNLSYNRSDKLRANSLNKFKAICHRMNNLLPKDVAEIERMDCLCRILPHLVHPAYEDSGDSIKSALFHMNCEKLKIMEVVFRLEQKNVVIIQNFTETIFNRHTESVTRISYPVMHFEYCSSEKTWRSDYMTEIIPRCEDRKEPVRIYLRCEVCLQNNTVRVFGQSEAKFITFLRDNFDRLLRCVLTEIIPH